MAKPGKPKPTSKALRSSKAGDLRRSRKPSPVAGKRKTASKTGNGRTLFGGLRPNAANFASLTPVSFLPRSADIHPDRAAVIHGTRRWTYRQLYQRSRQLASALAAAGVQPGDTVSVVLPNVPAMIEAHHGVPMLGAVLNTINTRLEPATIAYILAHGEAKVLITDREFAAQVGPRSGEAEETPARHRRGRCALFGTGRAARKNRIRGLHRDGRCELCVDAAGRRKQRDRAQLHLRHHRQSEGRGLSPSRHVPGIRRQRHGLAVAAEAGLPVDPADVPLQRLVLPVVGGGDGRHACVPAQGRPRADLPDDRGARRDPYVRRADGAQAC